jgi:fatty acid desaturase
MEEKVIPAIDYGLVLMAVISSINCLARADFNFIFSLVTLYLWNSLQSKDSGREELGKKIILLNLALLVLDLVCLVCLGSVWGDDLDPFASLHNLVLFLSWLNFFARIGIVLGMFYVFRDVIKPLAMGSLARD